MRRITNLKVVLRLFMPVLVLQLMFGALPAPADPVSVINDLDTAFAQIAANVMPAVVLIQVITRDGSSGAGSGFIISSDGDIMTNAHVVADAKEIGVTLYSKQEYEAKLRGVDRDTDIGLIKIEAQGLYCSPALLLRALAFRRVRQAGIPMSMPRLLSELDNIREVVNIYPKKRGQTKNRTQTVLTHTSDLQNRIMEVLEFRQDENAVLG